MTIDYEALAKKYEYYNSPKRWKNLVIASLIMMTIVIAVLVVLSIVDSDMKSSIDLFLARNYKCIFWWSWGFFSALSCLNFQQHAKR